MQRVRRNFRQENKSIYKVVYVATRRDRKRNFPNNGGKQRMTLKETFRNPEKIKGRVFRVTNDVGFKLLYNVVKIRGV